MTLHDKATYICMYVGIIRDGPHDTFQQKECLVDLIGIVMRLALSYSFTSPDEVIEKIYAFKGLPVKKQ